MGCSTGGFTDCLLKRGAASVLSVDVGYAQFDWSLRRDSRVTLLERTNIVDVPTPERAGSIQLAVCDVSFTSVTTVLPAVLSLLSANGAFLTLVKPQFEAPRDQVGEGGVIRNPAVRLHALERIAAAFADAGLGPVGCCESPVRGHKGEYLLFGRHDWHLPPSTSRQSLAGSGGPGLKGSGVHSSCAPYTCLAGGLREGSSSQTTRARMPEGAHALEHWLSGQGRRGQAHDKQRLPGLY